MRDSSERDVLMKFDAEIQNGVNKLDGKMASFLFRNNFGEARLPGSI